ncbi:MAG: OadG family protein [Ignavibacteriales bacterium]|jgi:Na+-transporting methylmalonyl-CoA/oxaloacetate decarboxylase gamma subunit|nr:OadG family protein [Ignavibacteriaceae bacterium]NLH61368.1 OadG family protein [Ignavibacteriales bacterium]HOJ19560.1 OadG family protein [Ignavibacteriaceae bacterium]HPO55248.1 OadG family protein [Ignavibacteriaceae bacterium]
MTSFIFAVTAIDSMKIMAKKTQQLVQTSDPLGVGMTMIGMGIVFLSLLLLYQVFLYITKLLNYQMKRSLSKKGESKESIEKQVDVSGDVHAAIATALHLYLSEIHDFENTVLTIGKVSRTYSPWSSKIYGLRQYHR